MNSGVKMSRGLTHVAGITASTLELIDNTSPQAPWHQILRRKDGWKAVLIHPAFTEDMLTISSVS